MIVRTKRWRGETATQCMALILTEPKVRWLFSDDTGSLNAKAIDELRLRFA